MIVRGVAAHAGIEPQKGASAVQELAHQILRINAMQDLDRGSPRSTSCRCRVGCALERDPGRSARATVDVRVPTAAVASEIAAAFRALRPSTAAPRSRHKAGSTVRRWNAPALVERLPHRQARDVAGEMGLELAEGGTGGGSDGNFTAALRGSHSETASVRLATGHTPFTSTVGDRDAVGPRGAPGGSYCPDRMTS